MESNKNKGSIHKRSALLYDQEELQYLIIIFEGIFNACGFDPIIKLGRVSAKYFLVVKRVLGYQSVVPANIWLCSKSVEYYTERMMLDGGVAVNVPGAPVIRDNDLHIQLQTLDFGRRLLYPIIFSDRQARLDRARLIYEGGGSVMKAPPIVAFSEDIGVPADCHCLGLTSYFDRIFFCLADDTKTSLIVATYTTKDLKSPLRTQCYPASVASSAIKYIGCCVRDDGIRWFISCNQLQQKKHLCVLYNIDGFYVRSEVVGRVCVDGLKKLQGLLKHLLVAFTKHVRNYAFEWIRAFDLHERVVALINNIETDPLFLQEEVNSLQQDLNSLVEELMDNTPQEVQHQLFNIWVELDYIVDALLEMVAKWDKLQQQSIGHIGFSSNSIYAAIGSSVIVINRDTLELRQLPAFDELDDHDTILGIAVIEEDDILVLTATHLLRVRWQSDQCNVDTLRTSDGLWFHSLQYYRERVVLASSFVVESGYLPELEEEILGWDSYTDFTEDIVSIDVSHNIIVVLGEYGQYWIITQPIM